MEEKNNSEGGNMGASKNPGEKTNDDHAEATVDDLEGEGFLQVQQERRY